MSQQTREEPRGDEFPVQSRRGRWQIAGICVLLAILVFTVFGQTIGFGFVNFDDPSYVYANAAILRGFSLAGIEWAFTHVHSGNWHPLTTIFHMLDCQMFGVWPGGHHLVNVLLHAACAVLLFLLLLEMTGAMWRSAFVAAVFAIHPLRAESVAWVSELKDVLSGLFFMLSLRAYARYARAPGSGPRYVLVIVWFALGLLSKPMLVTVPCVLLLLDYWPLGRFQSWGDAFGLLREKLPLFGLAALSCIATVIAQKQAIQPISNLAFSRRVGNALAAYVIYLGKLIWPVHLAVLYPLTKEGRPVWEMIVSLVLLAALSACAYGLRRKQPYLLTGWLWYLGMLVPVIGIMQVGSQELADRYTYLPEIGVCISGTWMVADWSRRWTHRQVKTGVLSAGILCALLFAAVHQVAYWRDSIALWTHTLGCTRGNSISYTNFGSALLESGRGEEAIAQYRTALQINPAYAPAHDGLGSALHQQGQLDAAIDQYRLAFHIQPDDAQAHFNLGNTLSQQGHTEEAAAEYREAVRIDPTYVEGYSNLGDILSNEGRMDEAMAEYRAALQANSSYAGAHYGLGNALLKLGRGEEAIAEYETTIQLDPANADAHVNLGMALHELGHPQDAIAEYRKAVQIRPGLARAHYNLGNVLLEQGETGEAIEQTRKSLALQPANGAFQNRLAWLLATVPEASFRDGAEAVKLATQASQSAGGNDPNILRTLAAAYAEVSDFPNANKTARTALELAESQKNTNLAAALSQDLKSYQSGQRFHD